MQYLSTRGGETVSLDKAIRNGIAADGGLFLPDKLPVFDSSDFADAKNLGAVAETVLAPFFEQSELRSEISAIVAETYSFDIPVNALSDDAGKLGMLELFHGPTAAFKDVGARFLAACLTRLESDADDPLTILVATSGDTGGAVAAAFDQKPGIRVAVLFPDGRVSARQEQQLCCWSENIMSLRVAGAFDDCQAMVKAALADDDLRERHRFSSANSINIGRLLPQSIYYADASLRHFRNHGTKPGFIIPTGNLGNAFACLMAREMGLPIGPVILATNANRTIADYFQSLVWAPRDSVQTLANAMDVGNPSNMERLRSLLGEADELRDRMSVTSVTDNEIRAAIIRDHAEYGFATCPHTATATHAYRALSEDRKRAYDWIVVATAHPAKFETIVEPLINQTITPPPELAAILSRPAKSTLIEAVLPAFAKQLNSGTGIT